MSIAKVTVEENGTSDTIELRRGEYVMFISSTGWAGPAVATLQVGSLSGTWQDAKNENDEVIAVSENYHKIVPGGIRYRLVVSNIDDPITLEFDQTNIE